MTTTNSQQITVQAVLPPLVNGVFSMMVVGMMVGMVATGKSSSSSRPKYELAEINERISKLGYVVNNLKEAVAGHREHLIKLMHDKGLTVMPSTSELKAHYASLYLTEQYTTRSEKSLDGAELRLMLLKKRRKELQIALGIRMEED